MQYLSKMKYNTLYRFWIGLYAATVVLGLLFPGAQNAAGRFFLGLIAAVFFVPPWLILAKAKKADNRHHIRVIRYLSIAWLAVALVLFCAGILSVWLGEGAGNLVHILMSVICAPLVCSNYYVMPMFLWATLLIGSFGKGK